MVFLPVNVTLRPYNVPAALKTKKLEISRLWGYINVSVFTPVICLRQEYSSVA